MENRPSTQANYPLLGGGGDEEGLGWVCKRNTEEEAVDVSKTGSSLERRGTRRVDPQNLDIRTKPNRFKKKARAQLGC